jgi:hypothetical protein
MRIVSAGAEPAASIDAISNATRVVLDAVNLMNVFSG